MAICRQSFETGEIETGGELYGLRGNDGVPVVLVATAASEAAVHEATRFEQGVDYVRACSRFLNEAFRLDYLGRWHLHHVLGLEQPSQTDRRSAASIVARNSLLSFVELIVTFKRTRGNECVKVNAFEYAAGILGTRTLQVLPSTSPIREQLLGSPVFPSRSVYAWRFPWSRITLPGTPSHPAPSTVVELPAALGDQIAGLPETAQKTVRFGAGSESAVLQFLLSDGRRCRVGYLSSRYGRPVAVAAKEATDTTYTDLTETINPTGQDLTLREIYLRASRSVLPRALSTAQTGLLRQRPRGQARKALPVSSPQPEANNETRPAPKDRSTPCGCNWHGTQEDATQGRSER